MRIAQLSGTRRAVLASDGYPCVRNILSSGAALADPLGSLDKLHTAAFTAEGWFKLLPYDVATYYYPIIKCNGVNGWRFFCTTAGVLVGQVKAAVAQAYAIAPSAIPFRWNHIAMQYNDIGARKVRLLANGANLVLSAAADGAVIDDTGQPLSIFSADGIPRPRYTGWVRISNIERYAISYDVPPRYPPPATDANTVALLYFNEMTGTSSADQSGAGHTANLAGSYAWTKD